MKIKKKIKKKSGSKTEILRNTEAQPKQLVSYKKKKECMLEFMMGPVAFVGDVGGALRVQP